MIFFQGGRTTRLDRKESYKAQRRSYAKEKKRVEKELLSTFKDQSIIVLADWLKVRLYILCLALKGPSINHVVNKGGGTKNTLVSKAH